MKAWTDLGVELDLTAVVSRDEVTLGVYRFSRTDLLSLLGAVATVEVPAKIGAVVVHDRETYVRHADTDFEGWSQGDGTLNSDLDVKRILEKGGIVLSEGVDNA